MGFVEFLFQVGPKKGDWVGMWLGFWVFFERLRSLSLGLYPYRRAVKMAQEGFLWLREESFLGIFGGVSFWLNERKMVVFLDRALTFGIYKKFYFTISKTTLSICEGGSTHNLFVRFGAEGLAQLYSFQVTWAVFETCSHIEERCTTLMPYKP